LAKNNLKNLMDTNKSNLENSEKKIISRGENFLEWYQDVISVAELAEHGPVRGTMIIKPYGYAIWENIQKYLDNKIKETGVMNAYFPLLIPEQFLNKEKDHVEGFSPEIAAVTYAGGKRLNEALVIRPTSETIIYDAFSKWVHSHRDLPLLINQWANVVRWELRPRLFLRTTEFLWQEGHTAHATEKEADERARMMLGIYEGCARDYFAIPVIPGKKTESEKFAGANVTYTIEAMMQDGKALQFATSHDLGQNFAKVFGIEFTNEAGNSDYCFQTSWGLSTRTIGGMIMVHSDDIGLVLPPRIAPIQVIVVPIWPNDAEKANINSQVEKIVSDLEDDIRIKIDYEDGRPGKKFFKWEKKGVPIRMEVGPKDIKNNSVVLVRRDTGEKRIVLISDLQKSIVDLLKEIHSNMYEKAIKYLEERTAEVNSWDEFKEKIEKGYFLSVYWCGDSAIEKQIKEETGATIRCIPFDEPKQEGKCFYTGKSSRLKVVFAKAY
jgi:prolyl-tRNA synthetase